MIRVLSWLRALFYGQQQIQAALRRIEYTIDRLAVITMATQADVDALATQLQTIDTDISAELASLKQANPTLDLSGLTEAVGALKDLDVANTLPVSPAAPVDGSGDDSAANAV